MATRLQVDDPKALPFLAWVNWFERHSRCCNFIETDRPIATYSAMEGCRFQRQNCGATPSTVRPDLWLQIFTGSSLPARLRTQATKDVSGHRNAPHALVQEKKTPSGRGSATTSRRPFPFVPCNKNPICKCLSEFTKLTDSSFSIHRKKCSSEFHFSRGCFHENDNISFRLMRACCDICARFGADQNALRRGRRCCERGRFLCGRIRLLSTGIEAENWSRCRCSRGRNCREQGC